MKKKSSTILSIFYLIISAIFIALDQFTKRLAVVKLKDKESYIIIKDIFELRYLENRGAAFGILQNQKIFFVVITVVLLCLLIFIFLKLPVDRHFCLLRIIISLFVAGAIGNLIDRVLQNYVIDFFYFVLIDFPIFNVADIYVVTAAILFVVAYLFYYKEDDLSSIFKKKKTL